MPLRTHVLALLVLSLPAAGAAACSCYPVHLLLQNDAAGLRSMRDRADNVVHARVVKVLNSEGAEIRVIEDFKSSSELLIIKATGGDSATCGRGPFSNGEEGVFFIHSGEVNLCGKYSAESSLIDHLRKLKH